MGHVLIYRVSFCIALGCVALGCGDNKVGPDIPPVVRYFTPSAPESTVLNYALAWERRDSVMVDSVLSVDYEGTSVDMADPTPFTLRFFKSDEIRAVGGLASDPAVAAVEVELYPTNLSLVSNPADPPEWVTIEVHQARVAIYRRGGDDLMSTGSSMEFKLKPTTPAPSSPTDTAWTIVRWSEVHSGP